MMGKSELIAVLPSKLWIEGVGFVVVSVVYCLFAQRNLNVWVTLKKQRGFFFLNSFNILYIS